MGMVGSVLVENSMFSPTTERYKTSRTGENRPELIKRAGTVLLFWIRTLKTASWFCIVLAGSIELIAFCKTVLERSDFGPVLFLLLVNLMWCSPNILDYLDKTQAIVTKDGHGDTLSTDGDLSAVCRKDNGIPFICDGKFIRYMEI